MLVIQSSETNQGLLHCFCDYSFLFGWKPTSRKCACPDWALGFEEEELKIEN
jgi:hypothetical protein